MPSPSKRLVGDTVIVGDKTREALAAEFGGLVESVGATPPPKSATVKQLAELWGISECTAADRIRQLVKAGKLREVGKFRIQNGLRGLYPVTHYVRV